jgi:hypothetical protein
MMTPRYFLGRMDVITALAGAEPPSHRLEIEIELESDGVDPLAPEFREAIVAATEVQTLSLLSDQEGTGELVIVPIGAIRKALPTPITTTAAGIKIWGITLQTLEPMPKK